MIAIQLRKPPFWGKVVFEALFWKMLMELAG
jgi:hypothetical protein